MGLVLPSPVTEPLDPVLRPHCLVWPVPGVSVPVSFAIASVSMTKSPAAVVMLALVAGLVVPVLEAIVVAPKRSADAGPPVCTPLSSSAPATTLVPVVVTTILPVPGVGF